MPRTTRIIALVLLCLASASGALQALPSNLHPYETPRAEPVSLIKAVQEWFASIFVLRPEPADDNPSAARSKEGSQLDPDGHD